MGRRKDHVVKRQMTVAKSREKTKPDESAAAGTSTSSAAAAGTSTSSSSAAAAVGQTWSNWHCSTQSSSTTKGRGVAATFSASCWENLLESTVSRQPHRWIERG